MWLKSFDRRFKSWRFQQIKIVLKPRRRWNTALSALIEPSRTLWAGDLQPSLLEPSWFPEEIPEINFSPM